MMDINRKYRLIQKLALRTELEKRAAAYQRLKSVVGPIVSRALTKLRKAPKPPELPASTTPKPPPPTSLVPQQTTQALVKRERPTARLVKAMGGAMKALSAKILPVGMRSPITHYSVGTGPLSSGFLTGLQTFRRQGAPLHPNLPWKKQLTSDPRGLPRGTYPLPSDTQPILFDWLKHPQDQWARELSKVLDPKVKPGFLTRSRRNSILNEMDKRNKEMEQFVRGGAPTGKVLGGYKETVGDLSREDTARRVNAAAQKIWKEHWSRRPRTVEAARMNEYLKFRDLSHRARVGRALGDINKGKSQIYFPSSLNPQYRYGADPAQAGYRWFPVPPIGSGDQRRLRDLQKALEISVIRDPQLAAQYRSHIADIGRWLQPTRQPDHLTAMPIGIPPVK